MQVTHDISDEESNEEVVCKELNKAKRTRTYFYWKLEEIFENEEVAYDKLSSSNWKFKQNTESAEGDKSFFKCGENKKCKAGYSFAYNTENMSVSAFTNNVKHDHEWEDDTIWGIRKSTKKVIKQLYDTGVTKPMLLVYELRRQNVDEPKISQLNTYLATIRKTLHGILKSVIMIWMFGVPKDPKYLKISIIDKF